jgi:Fe-S cluster biogenesis protein NfuA
VDVDAAVGRVEELAGALEQIGDAEARVCAEELIGSLMALYGEGLERILAAIGEEGTPALRERLVDDGVVASLLVMHGLYPVDLDTRVREALAGVRPYMETHGGDVELLGVADGVARLRLEGHCRGCSASASTLEQGIRRALEEAAPDLLGIEVEGIDGAPAHPPPGVCGTLAVVQRGPAAEAPPAHDAGQCELCPLSVPEEHKHLLHLTERRILCVCSTCWAMRSGDAEFRPVGNRTVWLDDFALGDEQWAAFGLPIGLAFLMISSVSGGVVALYPSPAGATESELDLEAWADVCAANPQLELEPDAEALIVNRLTEPAQHVIAPIDKAYGLVGVVKSSWEGISGGDGVGLAVTRYLDGLRPEALVR